MRILWINCANDVHCVLRIVRIPHVQKLNGVVAGDEKELDPSPPTPPSPVSSLPSATAAQPVETDGASASLVGGSLVEQQPSPQVQSDTGTSGTQDGGRRSLDELRYCMLHVCFC